MIGAKSYETQAGLIESYYADSELYEVRWAAAAGAIANTVAGLAWTSAGEGSAIAAPGDGFCYIVQRIHIKTDTALTDFLLTSFAASAHTARWNPDAVLASFTDYQFPLPGLRLVENAVPRIAATDAFTGSVIMWMRKKPILKSGTVGQPTPFPA